MTWIRAATNPQNRAMGYGMADDGTFAAFGGAPAFPSPIIRPGGANVPYGNVRSFQITDWSGPGGYVLEANGWVTAVGTARQPAGQAPGVPFFYPIMIDLAMNPAANGQGFIVDEGGTYYGVSGQGVIGPTLSLNINTGEHYLRMRFDYSTGAGYLMTNWGRFVPFGSAAAMNWVNTTSVAGYAPYFGTFDGMRSFDIYDYVHGYGWCQDYSNGIYVLNQPAGWVVPAGYNYYPNWDIARDLVIDDAGLGANPITLTSFFGNGSWQPWIQAGTPTVVVVTPTEGSTITTNSRPGVTWQYQNTLGDFQASWQVALFSAAQYGIGGFDPATSPNTYPGGSAPLSGTGTATAVSLPIDIGLGVVGNWRWYVRATSTAGVVSAWDWNTFTMNIPTPPTPSVTATVVSPGVPLGGISLLIHANPASLVAGDVYGIQYRDSVTDNWRWVRGTVGGLAGDGSALVPDGSGNATIIDLEAPIGVTRSYQAFVYQLFQGNVVISGAASGAVNATLTGSTNGEWLLTDPLRPTAGGIVHLQSDSFELAQPTVATAFQPVSRKNPIVMTDGVMRGNVGRLELTAQNRAQWDMIEALMAPLPVALLRDPYGRKWYISLAYDSGGHLRGAIGGIAALQTSLATVPADCGETAPPLAGFLNHVTMPVIEVDRPLAGPSSGPMAIYV